MANVIFKRGLLANLPATKVDGTIYITTDERAMYVDNGTSRIRIGDIVVKENWAAIQNVGSANIQEGVLYYATAENILATHTSSGWKQINAQKDIDKLIKDLTVSINAGTATNTAKIGVGLTDYDNTMFASGEVTVAGAGAATVSRTDEATVTIGAADTYYTGEISATADSGKAKISLQNTLGGQTASGAAPTASTQAGGAVSIAGDTGIDVSVSGNTITLSGNQLTSADIGFDADGALGINVKDTHNTSGVADTVTPLIKLHDNTTHKFVSGTATLPVYTADEVDTKITEATRAVNAMTFKGIVPTSGLPSTNVSIGDTYKVDSNRIINSQSCRVGDMWIATAAQGKDETNGVLAAADIVWVYIPSGDDDLASQDITVTANNDGLIIKKGGDNIGTVSAADCLSVDGSAGNGIIIKHIALSGKTGNTTTAGSTADVAQTAQSSKEFTAITSLTYDKYGHVQSASTQKLTVVDTHNDVTDVAIAAQAVTGSTTDATIGINVKTADTTAGVSDTFTVHSDSLTVGASSGNLTLNLTWGSF